MLRGNFSPRSPSSRRRLLQRARSSPSPCLNKPVVPLIKLENMGSTDNGEARAASLELDRKAAIQAEIAKEDAMIYLDGPQIYTCGHCRTHLTSHDDIISKSFHGRHGRAYLFDQCVNVHLGKPENRTLITGVHSVCDIYCNRCKSMVGWTYIKAYEPSQKYKEGKFIIEKINLHMEETLYGIEHPAGERSDRGRIRSMSWGNSGRSSRRFDDSLMGDIVYEYAASGRGRSTSFGDNLGAPESPMTQQARHNPYFSPRFARPSLQNTSSSSALGAPLAPPLDPSEERNTGRLAPSHPSLN